MSRAAKDGNNFRREWDKEAFEARARARLDAELALEEEREEKKTVAQPIVQRAPLQRRTEDLQIAKYVGTRTLVTGAEALSGQMAGAYYCKVCECHLRDSANYLAHINGRKHNRMLGMSMRAERSTLGEVRARLEAHKERNEGSSGLSQEEKAKAFIEQFDDRLRQREEEMRMEAAEKKRAQRQAAKERGLDEDEEEGGLAAAVTTSAGATGEEAEEDEYVAEEQSNDFAEMMGFGGFGGSKKQGA